MASGRAAMPAAGTAVSPTASIRRMTSKRRDETSRSGSSWMPANSGRKKRSTMRSLNPSERRRSAVVVSGRRSRSGTEPRRTDATAPRMRSLSANEPIGERSVPGEVPGAAQRIADGVERTVEPHPGARGEATEVEVVEVDPPAELGVAGEQDLEPAVEEVPVDVVGADPPADTVGRLEHGDVEPGGGEGSGTGEAGQSGPDHDHVVFHGGAGYRRPVAGLRSGRHRSVRGRGCHGRGPARPYHRRHAVGTRPGRGPPSWLTAPTTTSGRRVLGRSRAAEPSQVVVDPSTGAPAPPAPVAPRPAPPARLRPPLPVVPPEARPWNQPRPERQVIGSSGAAPRPVTGTARRCRRRHRPPARRSTPGGPGGQGPFGAAADQGAPRRRRARAGRRGAAARPVRLRVVAVLPDPQGRRVGRAQPAGRAHGHQLPDRRHRLPGGDLGQRPERRGLPRPRPSPVPAPTRSWCSTPRARPHSWCRCPATSGSPTPPRARRAASTPPSRAGRPTSSRRWRTSGIPIDHYMEINFVSFSKLVDAVGGITIDFPNPARDDHSGLVRRQGGQEPPERLAGPRLRAQPLLHRAHRRDVGHRPHRRHRPHRCASGRS